MVRIARWLIFLTMSTMSRMTPLSNQTKSTNSSISVTERNKKDPKKNITDENNNETCSSCVENAWKNQSESINCIEPAMNDFPGDIFTQEQRMKGSFVFHFIIIAYACYAIAVVCDDFFVPSLEIIGKKTNMRSDVAGATLMAAGTSSPELFESVIGTFITNGDIGVGTIVGSALYNILAVTCFCGLFSGMVVPLDWWPLTRDCFFYIVSVAALIGVIYDEKVYWYEAVALLVLFGFYVLMMVKNKQLEMLAKKFLSVIRCRKDDATGPVQSVHPPNANNNASETSATDLRITPSHEDVKLDKWSEMEMSSQSIPTIQTVSSETLDGEEEETDEQWHPFAVPTGPFRIALWIATWPINFLFYITLFDVKKPRWESFYLATFLISIVYLGLYCYVVAWMTVIIGFTFGVPDTVMGISLMAIAISVPEGFSSVIVCKKGLGNMAISNSVGSNAFDILICLGLPWLIKALISKDVNYATIHSGGIVYSIAFLIASILIMYASIAIFGFKLNKKVGLTCLFSYIVLVGLACCVELNIFGYINAPSCVL